MIRRLPAILVAAALTLGVGCKKPVPPPPPATPAPAPPPEAPAVVPQEVVQMARNFQRIFFDFNSATLDAASRSALDANVAIMRDVADIRIEVQGHADERGTTDFNVALGQRRASSVQKYLKSQGIGANRVKVVSYGEERPLQRGGTETAWSQNRRTEFVITWGGDSNVRGTTDS